MRYFIYFLWIFLLLDFLSCRKKIATDTTLERTSALGEKFRSVLASSPQGWLVCIENKEGIHYNLYMQFAEGGRVKMKADFNVQSLTLRESSYAIKLLQQPTLSFNTYNYISLLSDPDLGNSPGKGLKTDFEYALTAELVELLQSTVSVAQVNRFTLRGILYESKISFKRANNASDADIVNQVTATEKLLSSLKYNAKSTLTVLSLGSSGGTEYHYDFRPNSKLFALTSLETPKKGAPIHYYFDICGEGGLTMRFARSKNTTKNQFVDAALMDRFEKMVFSNFSGGTDTTTITFNYSDGKNTPQSGSLTTKNILEAGATSPSQLASEEDSTKFINNNTFRLIDIVEAGTSWDLSNKGTVAYGNPYGVGIKFSGSVPNSKLYVLDFFRAGGSVLVAQVWDLWHTSIKPSNGKSYYVVYVTPWQDLKWRLYNASRGFAQYTGRDSSQYLSVVNKQNIFDKVYFNTPSGGAVSVDGTNAFLLFATTVGYQLHNISKRVVIQYDL